MGAPTRFVRTNNLAVASDGGPSGNEHVPANPTAARGPEMYRVVVATLLVAGLLAWPSGVDAQDTTVDADDVPIVWVDLESAGAGVSQSDPATAVVDQSSASAVLTSVTVDHGGLRSLSPTGGQVSADNISLPGDAAASSTSENGALVESSSGEFPTAVARALASPDLRRYLRGAGAASDDARVAIDLRFDPALAPDAYLIMAQSDPAAVVRLSPLGDDGTPIAEAPIAVYGPGAGWSTGFAPADQPGAEPSRLAVLAVSSLLAETGRSSLTSVRVEADINADFKLIPASAAGLTTIETDPAVLSVDPTPIAADAVTFTTAVYAGADGGAGCERAGVSIQAPSTATVTYCYTITNDGTEALGQVTVSDPDLQGAIQRIGDGPDELGPGQTARFYLEATPPPDEADGVLDGVHVSLVTVAAVGVESGHDYSANAEAIVFGPDGAGHPAISVALTAYAGHDGGSSCPGTDRTVVTEGAALTYCQVVTNTGNTFVHGLHIDQSGTDAAPDLVDGDVAEMLPLGPGESATFFVEVGAPPTPTTGTVASARVLANPVDEFCGDLPGLPDVVADDGTELTTSVVTPPDPEQNTPNPPPQPADPPTGNATPTPTPTPTAEPGPPPADPPTGTSPPTPPPADPPTGNANPTPEPGLPTEAPAPPASSQTGGGTPEELAFTGWETWIVVMAGIALVAGGLAAVTEAGRPRRPVPVRAEEGRLPAPT